MEKFHGHGSCAIGTDKAILNLFRSVATPTSRARIYDLLVGCKATPADLASQFAIQRTTGIGTEGSGFSPVNLDPDGPASQSDFGVGVFSAEPTKTSAKELLTLSMNQRATVRWVAAPGGELLIPATQNYGAALNCVGSTGTTAHEGTVFFEE
jgi:hypothetical protein